MHFNKVKSTTGTTKISIHHKRLYKNGKTDAGF